MRAFFTCLSMAPWVLLAQTSWAMDSVPAITASQPASEALAEVRDHAGIFSNGAERRAEKALRLIRHHHKVPVLVETIESLDGAWVADVARRRARAVDPRRLYVLAAEGERDVGVIAAREGPASRLTDREREAIRRAFLEPLRGGEADLALKRGVRSIETTMQAADTSSSTHRGWDVLIATTILAVALALRLASRFHSWYEGRRRLGEGAGDDVGGHEGDRPDGTMARPAPRVGPAEWSPTERSTRKRPDGAVETAGQVLEHAEA